MAKLTLKLDPLRIKHMLQEAVEKNKRDEMNLKTRQEKLRNMTFKQKMQLLNTTPRPHLRPAAQPIPKQNQPLQPTLTPPQPQSSNNRAMQQLIDATIKRNQELQKKFLRELENKKALEVTAAAKTQYQNTMGI